MGSLGPALPPAHGDHGVTQSGSSLPALPPAPIKSRRGRKQNDALPPSRSRDVQRAFRARRAERLAWLEGRVIDLENENLELRARLGIPDDPRTSALSHLSGRTPPQLHSSIPSGSQNPPTPLPLPLPALPRPPQTSASAWMPPAPLYMAHMHPAHQRGPSPIPDPSEAGEDDDDLDDSALMEFTDALAGSHPSSSGGERGSHSPVPLSGPAPPNFVPSHVAWNLLAPLSSAARTPNGENTTSWPSPASLGALIRRLVGGPGQGPGSFVRIDNDTISVSLVAIEHIVTQARQQSHNRPPPQSHPQPHPSALQQQPLIPHPPHLPNYPFSYHQSMQTAMSMSAPGPSMHEAAPGSQQSMLHSQQDGLPDLFGMGRFDGE